MRPLGPLGYLLTLTGPSLSQVRESAFSKRGRLVKWVEKSSIEKIRRLLGISERERHYRVLLTRENVSTVRHNLAPYTLPVIPRKLPLNIVEGEHFLLKDVRRLTSGIW